MDKFDLRDWNGFKLAGGNTSEPAWIDQVIIDSRRINSRDSLFVALPGRYQHGHYFIPSAAQNGAKYALVESSYNSPITLSDNIILLRVQSPLQALQEIATSYRRQKKAKVIAIAGSVGKTMTKDLLCGILETAYTVASSPESFNSQIGVPLSIFNIEDQHQIALIEAGMTQEGEIGRLAQIIQPDHTIISTINDRHRRTIADKNTEIQELHTLLNAVSSGQWTLVPQIVIQKDSNLSDAICWDASPSTEHLPRIYQNKDSLSVQFPNGHGCYISLFHQPSYVADLIKIATCASFLLGIQPDIITEKLKAYPFETTATENWTSVHGARLINEKYCADLSSLQESLRRMQNESCENRKIFLFSGIRQQGKKCWQEAELVKMVAQSGTDLFLIVGDNLADLLMPYLQSHPELNWKAFNQMEQALIYLQQNLQPKDLVLIKGSSKLPLKDLIQSVDRVVHDNVLWINLAAIAANIQAYQKIHGLHVRIMPMMKAFAYGIDSHYLSRFFKQLNIDIIGVAHVDEALQLKKSGITQSIFIIHATEDEAEVIAENQFEVAVSNKEQIVAFARAAKNQNVQLKLHLHVDTGMGRLGCRPENTLELAQQIASNSYLHLEGLMTHLSSSDEPQADEFTHKQYGKLHAVKKEIEDAEINIAWVHTSNSYGSLRFVQSDKSMLRIGLGLFGLIPNSPLKPALSLTSRIVGINEIKKGETVGYNRTYIATRENERVAILPLGYYDGLHVQYSGKGYALISGKKAPFIGRICMDFMMVDITEIPEAQIGNTALIFGKDEQGHYVDPHQLAQQGGAHIYQLITCLGNRIHRIFIYDEGL